MTQQRLNGLDVQTPRNKAGGEAVPEIMETKLALIRFLDNLGPDSGSLDMVGD